MISLFCIERYIKITIVRDKIKYICEMDCYGFIKLVNRYNTDFPLDYSDETVAFINRLLKDKKDDVSRWFAGSYEVNRCDITYFRKLSKEEYFIFEFVNPGEISKYDEICGIRLFDTDKETKSNEKGYEETFYDLTKEGRIYYQIQYAFSIAMCEMHEKNYKKPKVTYRVVNFWKYALERNSEVFSY